MDNVIYAQFDADGVPLGFWRPESHEPGEIPTDAITISEAQFAQFFEAPGYRKWLDGEVVPYEPAPPKPVIPDRVTRRQFRQQLIKDGLLASVETWVATQDELTQAAYADSGTFVRSDTMLQVGFAGLGFTTEQVDAFFTAAASL